MNAGLLLRRPFESRYNAFRRFLVANPGLSYSSLRCALLAKLGSRASTSLEMDALAQLYEEEYCRKYRIHYVPPKHTGISDYKNCPECARICYHSYLYNYPWFNCCPTHHRLILPYCPDCKAPWPSNSQIAHRQCPCCGIKLEAKHLAVTSPLTGLNELAVLDNAVQQYVKTPILSLGGWGRGPWEYGRCTSVAPSDIDWLNLVNPHTDEWKSACEAVGSPPLRAVYQRVFNLPPLAKDSGPTAVDRIRHQNLGIDSSVRRAVRRRLTRVLERLSLSIGWPQARLQIKRGGLQVLTQKEIFHICLKTWRSIVSDEFIFRNRTLPNFDYFRRAEFTKLPHKPVVMSVLDVIGNLDCTRPFGFSRELRERAVPCDLKVWFYEIELWRNYLALLGHLSTFNAALKFGLKWEDYYRQMPEDAAAFSDPSIHKTHLDMPSRDTLRVVVLQHHAFFTKASVLDSLSWVNHPDSRKLRFGKEQRKNDSGIVETLEIENAQALRATQVLIETRDLLYR